jgi:hypothetical protein
VRRDYDLIVQSIAQGARDLMGSGADLDIAQHTKSTKLRDQ